MEDLWPDFDIDGLEKETPLSILNTQAELLSGKTRNVVTAHIEVNEDYSIPFDFKYSFYLKSKSLNYSYLLFDIGFHTSLLPVYLFNMNSELSIELYKYIDIYKSGKAEQLKKKNSVISADSIDEFIEYLSVIFKSDNVRGLVKLLYDQSKIISRKVQEI